MVGVHIGFYILSIIKLWSWRSLITISSSPYPDSFHFVCACFTVNFCLCFQTSPAIFWNYGNCSIPPSTPHLPGPDGQEHWAETAADTNCTTHKKKPSMSISRSHTSTAWIFTNPSHETRGGQRGDGEFKQAAERWVRGGWYRGETCFYACNLILESSGLQLCVSLCASYKIWCLRVRYEILLSVWKWMQLMH